MTRRARIAVAFLGLAMASHAHAGTANADLTCHGRDPAAPAFVLEADIPGDEAYFSLALKAGGKQTVYQTDGSGDGDRIAVVEDLHYGVFTLSIWRGKDVEVTLYALPKSVRRGVAPDGRERHEFNALLSAPGNDLNDLVLRCTHDYGV
jgi:hypothetical protein